MSIPPEFEQFFQACVGDWVTERTYHYLKDQEVERSHTEFQIRPVSLDRKTQVLVDNHYDIPDGSSTLDSLPGFHLAFATVSEKGEAVSQTLNFLFVPRQQLEDWLLGDYLRDRAYEEARPMISQFRFDLKTRELVMTTTYTRSVSVDSITLINPTLRIRKILNYRLPAAGEPLQEVLLAGFGVEQKQP
jgi:CpeS-like protein